MKKLMLLFIIAGLVFSFSCSKTKKEEVAKTIKNEVKKEMKTDVKTEKEEINPLLADFNTPFKVPPFDKIKVKHYVPAVKEGIKRQQAEIDAIVNNNEAPTFANTIEALEKSGATLTRTNNIFNILLSCLTNEEMQEAAKVIAPLLSKHTDNINLNKKLFLRIKAVKEQSKKFNLTDEQSKMLNDYYKEFVRGGANLKGEQKERFKAINGELAVLSLKFGDNILKETNKFKMVIDKKEDLAGLPQSSIDAAAQTAKENKLENKWMFTIHKPSLIPFLQYSEKRNLREKMYKAYINKGDNNDDLDNKKNIIKIIKLRTEKAKLLGFKSHAHFKLDNNMAKTPEKVEEFLLKLWKPALGAFAVATKLFNITFTELKDIPKYHEDAKVFEVKNLDGSHLGVLYVDYFPRASKRGGAWMEAFRKQSNRNGKMVRPVISNNGNFSKPTADKPSLLTFEEVNTLFHEFGHALHGLLSQCTYEKTSGTAVTTYFNHIFAGMYSAGYYSYIWAEVLDADIFKLFKEKGIFDKKTAASFKKNIMEMGGKEEAMKLYIKFMGREPKVGPLLKKRGLSLHDLEDIEQEVKINIWKQLSKSETEIINLNSYIWRVTYNATCNILGKRYKEKWITFDEAQMEQVIVNEEYDNKTNILPDQEYERGKLMDILEESIDTMIDSRRQVLKLYIIGMSKKEIAKFLGWSVDKVRNLLYRGIKDLKIILEKRGVMSFF